MGAVRGALGGRVRGGDRSAGGAGDVRGRLARVERGARVGGGPGAVDVKDRVGWGGEPEGWEQLRGGTWGVEPGVGDARRRR
jgi:hypothetical protein